METVCCGIVTVATVIHKNVLLMNNIVTINSTQTYFITHTTVRQTQVHTHRQTHKELASLCTSHQIPFGHDDGNGIFLNWGRLHIIGQLHNIYKILTINTM